MTRLGNRSPSCSGFEAEPLCWLQHSANRWQQDWHSQENSSCGGQRAAERERSSQTEGEDREGGKGVLQGGNPPLCSTGPATPGAGPLCPNSPRASTYATHPSQGTQELSRTRRALRPARSPTPEALPGGLPSPFCPAAHTFQPARPSDWGQMAAWHRGYLSTQAGGTWASQVAPKSGSRRSSIFAWFLDLSEWELPTHAGVSGDLARIGSLCSALTQEHVGSIRIS